VKQVLTQASRLGLHFTSTPIGKILMQEHTILDETTIPAVIRRIAAQILERHGNHPLCIVGIQTRGVILADRLMDELHKHRDDIERGTLDISLYRDDLSNLAALPHVEGSDIPFEVEGANIVLCDDVLFTGRTIRAAMNVLLDYGRPQRIELAVLADRGHRELPIAATYTGTTVDTDHQDYLRVHFAETDGQDQVIHYVNKEKA
jgi:pyrimidine operon attenuation protein/uracil phosphoribosyltransferase